MGKEISTFGDIKIEKNKVYRNETPTFWEMKILEKY